MLLHPGRSCWRIEPAARFAVLVDGDAYFRAVRHAIASARCSVMVLGWDVDSRMRLVPEGADDGLPEALGDFLDATVARCPTLHAWVLGWDFPMLYAFERERLPRVKLDLRTHRRLHFRLDGRHPLCASHHQKVVVVVDAVAFVGGLDLAGSRWDRSDHQPDEPLRVDASCHPDPPFHDVQAMVDGEAARALGELARERWRRALVDPDGPVEPERVVRQLVPVDATHPTTRRRVALGTVSATLVALALAWQWTPLARLLDVDLMAGFVRRLADGPPTPFRGPCAPHATGAARAGPSAAGRADRRLGVRSARRSGAVARGPDGTNPTPCPDGDPIVKRILLVTALLSFAAAVQAADASCSVTAGEKKLAGAAKTSFMKKCEADAKAACETQAADRKLSGAAKNSFVKKCTTDAVGAK